MFDILINIYECALITWFLYSCFTAHKKHAFYFSVVFTGLNFFVITYINQYSPSQEILIIVDIVKAFIYLCAITYERNSIRLLFSTIPFVVFAVSNFLFLFSISMIVYHEIDYYTMMSSYQIPLVLLLQLFHTVIFYIITKKARKTPITIPDNDIYLGCFLLCLCLIMSVCYEAVMLGNNNMNWYLLLGMYCILAFCIVMIKLFKSIYLHSIQEEKQKIELEILKDKITTNAKLMKTQKELHEIRHDMKHFLKLLNESNDIVSKETIEELESKYNHLSIPIITPISSLNYALNIARDEAHRQGIDFVCAISINTTVNIDDEDIFLLVSNILDNAIQHIGSNKRIDFMTKIVGDNWLIKVANSIDHLDDEKEQPIIIQSDNHGYGVPTVIRIVEKLKGKIRLWQENSEFIVSILLPVDGCSS